MNHLLVGLLRSADPLLLLEIVAEAALGSLVAFAVLRDDGRAVAKWLRSLAFGTVCVIAAWAVFHAVLHNTYRTFQVDVPWSWAAYAALIAWATTGSAGLLHLHGRRSARTAMLSGSLAASGISSMLFTAMAGVVQPFALAYDLTGILVTVVIGSALFGFAFWEAANSQRRRPTLAAVGLSSAAITILCLGSLASILSFEGWMTAMAEPDDLSALPLVIIVTAEAAVILALSLLGSLVDNRTAARDRLAISRLRELASSTFEAITIHHDGILLDGNDVLSRLTGHPLAELVGQPISTFCSSDFRSRLAEARQESMLLTTEIVTAGGQLIPVEVLSRPITYAGQNAMVSALRDIRERRASEARIAFLAHHDPLTKLPNRAYFHEVIERELARSHRSETTFDLLCLDLDGFKAVNDTLGHAAGDALLCEVASRLRAHLRPDDFAARLGGDEFVVIHASTQDTAKMAESIVNSIAMPFDIDGRQVRIGTSIGIATCPLDGTDAEALMRNADVALYSCKQEGRGTFCVFTPELGIDAQQRAAMKQALQMALNRNELSLHYQPLYNSDRALVSFEALMRWHHPELGWVPPSRFIEVAEKSELIVTLGAWALETACAAAAQWPGPYRVAVNVSPRQLVRSGFAEDVERILLKTGLPPSRLVLEVTETALINNDQITLQTTQVLSRLGVRLALDDFGTGFSSLSYLHRFPFNKLKIDRAFVQRLNQDKSARSIVRAIVALSESLDLEVTAEGVETVEQFAILKHAGCHEFQGFLLSKPLPPEELAPLFSQQSRFLTPADDLEIMT